MSVETSAGELPVTMISSTYTNKYSLTPGLWWMNKEALAVELTKPRDNRNTRSSVDQTQGACFNP